MTEPPHIGSTVFARPCVEPITETPFVSSPGSAQVSACVTPASRIASIVMPASLLPWPGVTQICIAEHTRPLGHAPSVHVVWPLLYGASNTHPLASATTT